MTMADPNNYIIGQANPTPFASLQQGYALGQGIRQDQQAQQQQQAALQQAQALQQAYSYVANKANPTADDYSRLMLLDPKSSESIQRAWTSKNTAQQQSMAGDLGQIGAALSGKSPQPQIAADYLTKQADAIENSNGGQPTPDSQAKRDLAQVALQHPALALGKVYALLNSNEAGKGVAAGLLAMNTDVRAQDLQPDAVVKAAADASKAQTEATIAAKTLPDAIAKPGIDNAKTTQEIEASKLAGQISQLNTQIAQANSETTRGQLVLERDKLVQQQKQTQFEQGQNVQSSMDAATTALATVDRIANHPGLSGVLGIEQGPGVGGWLAGKAQLGGVGTLSGKVSSYIPGTDAADFKATLETLNSQLFQNNIKAMVGMGSLSDAEGKKIATATANLSTDQSASSFRTALGVVRSTLLRAQARAAANPQASTTNAGFVLNSPKYGAVTEGMVTKLMKDHPGATRDSIIQFLQQPTGQADLSQGIPPSPDRTPPNPFPPQ